MTYKERAIEALPDESFVVVDSRRVGRLVRVVELSRFEEILRALPDDEPESQCPRCEAKTTTHCSVCNWPNLPNIYDTDEPETVECPTDSKWTPPLYEPKYNDDEEAMRNMALVYEERRHITHTESCARYWNADSRVACDCGATNDEHTHLFGMWLNVGTEFETKWLAFEHCPLCGTRLSKGE